MKTLAKTLRGWGALLVAAVLALSLIPVTKAWAAGYEMEEVTSNRILVKEDTLIGSSRNWPLEKVIYRDPSSNEIETDTPSRYPYTIASKTKDGVEYTRWKVEGNRSANSKWQLTLDALPPTYTVTLNTDDLKGASARVNLTEMDADDLASVIVAPEAGKQFAEDPVMTLTNAHEYTPLAWDSDLECYYGQIDNPTGPVIVTITGEAKDVAYTAQVNTDALNGGTAELSKTADIKPEDTVSVTIKPSAGMRFDTAPTMTVDGATVKAALQKRPADGAYVGTISTFTKNATVTVTGDAVDAWSATLDKAGLKGGTARLSPTDNLGPDSVSVLTVTFDSNKTVTSAPVVTADNAKVKLALQDGKTYTYEITEFTGNTTVTVTGEAVKPDITVGGNGTHVVGAGGALTFTCSLPLDELQRVLVDGTAVVPSNYDAKSGSTVITLKAAFLDTLSVGKHTLTLAYTEDRAVSVDFTIAKEGAKPLPTDDKSKIAKTGDPLNAAPLAVAAGISGIALIAGAALRKKSQQS